MFEHKRQGTVDVVWGAESLISERLDQLTGALDQCLTRGQPQAVLDLGGVPLVDSAALEKLLDFQDECRRRGGALKLVDPNPLCEEILLATGVAGYFEIYRDIKAAVGSFVR